MAAATALADDTRTRLLDAAGRVFAEAGYKGATVRKICARARVNVALVNYYFGDKEALYAEVLRHSLGSAKAEILAIEGGPSPEDTLREMIQAMMQRVNRPDRPVWHYQLLVHEIAQPTQAMIELIDLTMRPIYERFRSVIGRLLGLSPDHEKTRLCTHSVIAQVVHYVHSRHLNRQLWPELELTPERLAEIGTHIADFSLAYLRESAQGEAAQPQGEAAKLQPAKSGRKETRRK